MLAFTDVGATVWQGVKCGDRQKCREACEIVILTLGLWIVCEMLEINVLTVISM